MSNRQSVSVSRVAALGGDERRAIGRHWWLGVVLSAAVAAAASVGALLDPDPCWSAMTVFVVLWCVLTGVVAAGGRIDTTRAGLLVVRRLGGAKELVSFEDVLAIQVWKPLGLTLPPQIQVTYRSAARGRVSVRAAAVDIGALLADEPQAPS